MRAAPPLTGAIPVQLNEPEVYLCTDEYPFTTEQFDRERENLLVGALGPLYSR